MAILVDECTRIIIQGITGNTGQTFAERMLRDGTPLVGGVTPGKGGLTVHGVPVFDTVAEAATQTQADASLITVPPRAVKDAFLEAVHASIKLIWIYTENVPVHDVAFMIAVARQHGARLLGPNAAGAVSPDRANLSDLNAANLRAGRIGIVSRSGTLTYEVLDGLHDHGLGESTIVCLGGDQIIGTDYSEILALFAADEETEAVILIGEIGGTLEMRAAETWTRAAAQDKPLIAYIAGQAAPPGKRMGHAGAIVSRTKGESALEKIDFLERSGAHVARLITDVPDLVARALPSRSI